MAHNDTYAQLLLSVEDVQAYLFLTGQLQEMIGGKELISLLPKKALSFCQNDLHLAEVEKPGADEKWFMVLQNDIGKLRLLMPTKDLAKQVLSHVSLWAIENCPGLPLYGTCTDLSFTSEDLKQAAKQTQQTLTQLKITQPRPERSVWPFTCQSPLDGLPAIKFENFNYWSCETLSKVDPNLLEYYRASFKNFEDLIRAGDPKNTILPANLNLHWANDITELTRGCKVKKVGLLHFRVNSLKAIFQRVTSEGKNDPAALNKRTIKLAEFVDKANTHAFAQAMLDIIGKDSAFTPSGNYLLPAIPIMLQGDELIVFLKADLAFDFADKYAEAFETFTQKLKITMSVGGGMVIIPPRYSFNRAWKLCSALTDNAKAMSQKLAQATNTTRPSSIDYLFLTNDIDSDIDNMRKKSYTTRDGCLLTAKPFICGKPCKIVVGQKYVPDAALSYILQDARLLHDILPTSHLREAIDLCRSGRSQAKRAWQKLRDNLIRGLGVNQKDAINSFDRIFPKEFFFEKGKAVLTLLGDYLELRHLFDSREGA